MHIVARVHSNNNAHFVLGVACLKIECAQQSDRAIRVHGEVGRVSSVFDLGAEHELGGGAPDGSGLAETTGTGTTGVATEAELDSDSRRRR